MNQFFSTDLKHLSCEFLISHGLWQYRTCTELVFISVCESGVSFHQQTLEKYIAYTIKIFKRTKRLLHAERGKSTFAFSLSPSFCCLKTIFILIGLVPPLTTSYDSYGFLSMKIPQNLKMYLNH